MNKSYAPKVVAAFAAILTTLVLFSSVVSIAESDKAELAAAQNVKQKVFASNDAPIRR